MRNRINKCTAILLSLLLLMTAFPFTVPAAETEIESVGVSSGTTGDCTWTLDNGTLTISGNGAMEGYSSDSPLPWGTSINKVVIEKGVTSIGYQAFYGCNFLQSVIIPDSVTSIGNDAFYNCTSLTSVYINDIAAWCNITFWGFFSRSNPLTYAKNLYLNNEIVTDLIIPDSVTSIGSYAFYDCTSLASITIPDSVTSIGDLAFCGCTSLTSATIGNSVTSIGEYTFCNCTSLTSITIPDSVTSIGGCAFEGCTSLASIIIPDSVTSIGDGAFGYYYDSESYWKLKLDGFTIYGYSGSAAQNYAKKNGFVFSDLKTGAVTDYNNTKATNPIKVTAKTKTVKASKLKKAKVTVKNAITVKKARGAVTYTKVSGSKYLTVSKKGVITVKKGKYKKNTTLKIKVKVTAKGNSKYEKGSKTVTVKIKIE